MKELSIEEKAKAYDEAKARMNRAYNNNRCTIGFMNEIFPELKESEDERIRKVLIEAFSRPPGPNCVNVFNGIPHRKIVAWLEKQGEHANFRNKIQIGDKVTRNEDGVLVNLSQLNRVAKKDEKQGELKPTELPKVKSVPLSFKEKLGIFMQYTSVDLEKEENQQLLDEAAKELLQLAYSDKANEIALASAKTWEESMAILMAANNAYRRGQKEYKSAEWSEEDEQLYNDLSDTYYYNDEDYPEETYKLMLKRVLDWMNKRAKSLRPQNRWKPSEEQMSALSKAIAFVFDSNLDVKHSLESLYNELKKL